jgi:hypothetical protein
MPGNRLICKQCGGFEFKQVKVILGNVSIVVKSSEQLKILPLQKEETKYQKKI